MPARMFAEVFIHPDDSHLVSESIQLAQETTDPDFQYRVEARILRADGQPRNVIVWFRVEKDSQGKTIRLYGVNQDINERKQAEESTQLFQFSVDQSMEAIFWMARDGCFTYVNEKACSSLGYSREELLHLHLWDIDPIYPKELWDSNWDRYQRDRQGGGEASLVSFITGFLLFQQFDVVLVETLISDNILSQLSRIALLGNKGVQDQINKPICPLRHFSLFRTNQLQFQILFFQERNFQPHGKTRD